MSEPAAAPGDDGGGISPLLWVLAAVIAVLTAAVVAWQVTGFGLGWWLEVHLGIVNESGPYYGFSSGSGSDIGEVVIIGGLVTITAGLWKRFNCHNERCWRLGIHRIAGGAYVVCRRHHAAVTGHAHRKLSTEFLTRMHCEHLDRASGGTGG